MCTITLSDGTIINNLSLDGGTFTTEQQLTAETFEGKLDYVLVHDDNGITSSVHDGYLYQCESDRNGTRFVIGEKTEDMKREERNTELELALTELYEMIIGG